jgi:N-acetylmuramic acid 6-phosphate etherase
MSVAELLSINQEDKTVPLRWKALPQIENLVTQIVAKMKLGGRLLYRCRNIRKTGVVDASECPPTFGYPLIWLWVYCWWWLRHSQAVENATATQAWKDLIEFNINENDVVRIAASGTTPYVIGGLQSCNENNIITGSISCNAAGYLKLQDSQSTWS